MSLADCLRLEPREMISLVGGGGKTTLMFRLAHELAAAGKKVVSGTTTKIVAPRSEADYRLILEETGPGFLDSVSVCLENEGQVTVGKTITPSPPYKVVGCDPSVYNQFFLDPEIDYVIVEADGAQRKPLKAPREHEPVIPRPTTTVIGVIGLDALGKPLDGHTVFQPELFSVLTGLPLGSLVTFRELALLAAHPHGLFKDTPSHAKRVLFLNKMDLLDRPLRAADLMNSFSEAPFPLRIVCGSLLPDVRIGLELSVGVS